MVKNHLTIVGRPGSKVPKPPRTLGPAGTNLWSRIVEQYVVNDAGGIELLLLACKTLDRVQALRTQIDREGEVLKVKGSIKDHPALRHELAGRAFIGKCLSRMGLNVEVSSRSPGRPSGMGNLGVGDEYVRRILGAEE
jgi:hypothetical protein